ncbi:NPCBM/NEW2 domain-containing protein [Amycolatopsis sp. NPDC021455]|uniref:NPCBM/NEW2 domain-containing protein n=1 Tax=Amycolatopsis sp. NPDC021455 TaxID=3154901 RepID=UPI0033FDAF65
MRRLAMLLCALFLTATATAVPASADTPPDPVPGDRPPLGITWATGDHYCLYDSGEDIVKAAADRLVTSGLRDAGYRYVMLGDCWQAAQRDADGKLTARATFSASIPALVDYVHSRGLKIGFYSGTGAKTCSNQAAGSLDHEDLDAQTFADWGADYLRYDTCYSVNGDAPARVKKMADALKRTGRPITLEVDDFDRNQSPWLWARAAGAQVWRTYKNSTFDFGYSAGSLDKQYGLEGYNGPGGWNNPGAFTFSYLDIAERQAKLGLWAVLNAPLVTDLALTADRTFPAAAELANPDIIAVDQDWAGVGGHKVRDTGWTEVWTKPMSDGSAVLVLFNRGELAAPIATSVADAGLPAAAGYRVRDLWTGEETETTGALGGTVGRHAATVLRVWPANVTAAPRTSLAVDLPESVPPSQPVTATVRFTNNGSTPVTGAHLRLTAPAQWQFDSPAEADTATVDPGATWETAVTLHPVPTATQPFKMPATVTYTTAQGTRTATASAESPLVHAPNPPYDEGTLDTMYWMSSENGLGPVERKSTDNGHPFSVNGRTDTYGLGAHAPSVVRYYLGGKCKQFTATVGVDDRGPNGTLGFRVIGDGVELEATGNMRHGDPAQYLAVPVTGVQVLVLAVDDASDGSAGDWGDWLSPYVTC